MKLPAALLAFFAISAVEAASRWSTLAAKGSGIVKLNARTFDEITASPRNYSVSIALTALPGQYKCQPCR